MRTIRQTARALTVLALSLGAVLSLGGCGQGAANSASSATSKATSTTPPAPTINLSGTPPTSVVAGSAYAFQPGVSASSGTVTFSISGQPSWATFDAGTGALSGTPAVSNVGTTGSIIITASDGATTASMQPFTIDVMMPTVVTGSASLSWVAPTENTNGSLLNDLAGYYIHYGTSPSALNQTIEVPGAATVSYSIVNLPQGTYYFTVTAYSSQGTESSPSNVASKTI
jgi:hypothetical protein